MLSYLLFIVVDEGFGPYVCTLILAQAALISRQLSQSTTFVRLLRTDVLGNYCLPS